MRPFKRVKMLDADEYRVLKRAVQSRKIAVGRARRAKIVLLSNQGLTAREIAERLGCNERTALKWIGRFNRHGVAGLEEVLRSGRPRVYGPEDVGAVIQAALRPRHGSWGCHSPPGPSTGSWPTCARRRASAWAGRAWRRCSPPRA